MLSREERARQFLPFDSLKGLSEALKEKEEERIEKIELSEEQLEKISEVLNTLEKEDLVLVTYYLNKQYVNKKGIVNKMDEIKKKIVVDNENVYFVDILNIVKL